MPAPSRPTVTKTTDNKTEETNMTTSTPDEGNFWDDPDVKPASATFARFVAVGDTFGGTIAKFGKRTFGAGTADEHTAPELTFAQVDGEDQPTLTAGQTLLQQALWEMRPAIGDHLEVTLARIEKRGTKTLKRFKVSLTRAGETVPEVIDQTDG